MAERRWHPTLEVGVGGDGLGGVFLGELAEPTDDGRDAGDDFVAGASSVESDVGGDLVVAATSGVELPPGVADERG